RRTRSRTFPAAPPRIKPRPHLPSQPPARSVASNQTSSAITATEKAISRNASQGDRELASSPKATPGLLVCARLRRPGIITRSEPVEVSFSTAYLLIWSAARTPSTRNERPNQPEREKGDIS